MLLALSLTGIRAEAVVSHFKAKGGWKSTEVHFDMTFMADSSKFENELSSLKSIIQTFDNLDFRPVVDVNPVASNNTSPHPMAATTKSKSTTDAIHPVKRIKTT